MASWPGARHASGGDIADAGMDALRDGGTEVR